MTDDIRECPNCGAYVMSEDQYCPRCDYLLDAPSTAPASDAATDPDAASPEPLAGKASGDLSKENASEADLPTNRLPWTRPAFPDAPEKPDEAGEREAALPDEPAEAPAPEFPDATRAHTSQPLPAPDQLPEFAAGDEAPDVPASDEAPAPTEHAADDRDAGDESPAGKEEPAPQGANHFEAEEAAFAAEKTLPRLTDDLVQPEDEIEGTGLDDSEMPTAQFRRRLDEPEAPDESTLVRRRHETPPVGVPPAPYTPPPGPITPPPMPAYAPDPGVAYLQQRIQAYLHGGYRLHVHAPHEAALSQGKQLGVAGWMLALVSVIGFLWYLLIMAASGFRSDMAYLVLEADGRVYEDGPGAAHVRHQRSRTGRRWSIFGLVIFVLSLGLAAVLVAVAAVVLTQDRYQAALREAYPAVTLFEERFSDTAANPDDVRLAETGAVVYAILSGIAVLGVWGGATLFVIGAVHAGAYRVKVPPLPGYA